MAWFIDEQQLTQGLLLELIHSLGAAFPELSRLQELAKQGAGPSAIGSQLSTTVEQLRSQQTVELESHRVFFLAQLTEARQERDYWHSLHDRDLLQEVKEALTATQTSLVEQTRKTEATRKALEALQQTLELERQQAAQNDQDRQRFAEEQNAIIVAQHHKLVRLFGDD